MTIPNSIKRNIRTLRGNEKIPYDLLLLADETIEAIDRHIHNAEIFVLEEGTKIIAVYVLSSIDASSIEIKYIAVDELLQGQGLGTLLLRDASVRAKEKGFKTMIIGTGNSAFKQLYLYQKEGFEIYDIKKDFFINNCPEPIYENGIRLNHMIMLRKIL